MVYDEADQGALFARIEFVSEMKKLLVTVACKSGGEPVAQGRLAALHGRVAAALAVVAKVQPSPIKHEQYARAVAAPDQKPVLVRHSDLLEYRAKGKTTVPIKGATVPLDELLLVPSGGEEGVASLISSSFAAGTLLSGAARIPPPPWLAAATLPILRHALAAVAEAQVLVQSAFDLHRQLLANPALSALLPRPDSLRLWKALAPLSSCKWGNQNACVGLLIEVGKRIATTAVGAPSGELPLSLRPDFARLLSVASFLSVTHLGDPLDTASLGAIQALCAKFGTAVQLLVRLAEEGVGDNWKKDQRDRARLLVKAIGTSMRVVRAFAAGALTADAVQRLAAACSELTSLDCAELEKLLNLRSSADAGERLRSVSQALESAAQQVALAPRALRADDDGSAPSLTRALQTVSAFVASALYLDARAFDAAAREVAPQLPLLKGLALHRPDVRDALQPLLAQLEEVVDPVAALFSRLHACNELRTWLERAELTRLTRDTHTMVLSLLKDAVARVVSLVALVQQEGLGAPVVPVSVSQLHRAGKDADGLQARQLQQRKQLIALSEGVDRKTTELLQSLPAVTNATALGPLMESHRATWMSLLSGVQDSLGLFAPATRVKLSSLMGEVRRTVGDLFELLLSDRASANQRLVAWLTERVRNALLLLQLEGPAASPADATATAESWRKAHAEMQAVLADAQAPEERWQRSVTRICDALLASSACLADEARAQAVLSASRTFMEVLHARHLASLRLGDCHETKMASAVSSLPPSFFSL